MTLAVIGTGFGRTGTDSMREALNMLGFGPCHHMFEVTDNPLSSLCRSAQYSGVSSSSASTGAPPACASASSGRATPRAASHSAASAAVGGRSATF